MKSVIPVGLLLVALVVLGTLQYQWIGQITTIERQKLQSSLVNASNRFAMDFAQERDRLYGLLESRYRNSGDVSTLIDSHRGWAQAAQHPNLVKTLYVADPDTEGKSGLRLRQIFFEREMAVPIQWPGDLTNLAMALEKQLEPVDRASSRGRPQQNPIRYRPNPGDAMVLVIPMMGPRSQPGDPRPGQRGLPAALQSGQRPPSGWVIARLERAVMTDDILPEIAERHFPHNDGQGYRVAVVDTDEDLNQVYPTTEMWSPEDLESYDYAIDLFGYSPSSRNRPPGLNPGRGGPERGRPGERGGERGGGPGRGPGRGGIGFGPERSAPLGHHWRLLVKNEAGSLDAAVEQLRRRNLAVSFGVLIVLAAAALILVFSGQRARALGKLQMEFAAGVSHELRTPLTVIQSAAHNLRSGVVRDPRNIEQYAEIVQKEARRLSGMVEQVMAYAETQSGRRRYDITVVDVTDVVEQALKTLSFVDDVEVRVDKQIPADLPPALADPVAFSQCLQNLISNAVKYGQRDGVVELGIQVLHDAAARRLRLSVMDRGAGVPASDVPHLFEAFHRGSNTSTSTPGNGIGLHLVRKTIESQHGAVTYASRPGGGSVFTLVIPSAESESNS